MIRQSARPSIRPSVRHSAWPHVRPSIRPSVRPSVRPFLRPSARSSVHPLLLLLWENAVFLSICRKNQWKPYGNHQETMEFVDNATWKPCGNHWKPTGNHVFSGRKSYLTMT